MAMMVIKISKRHFEVDLDEPELQWTYDIAEYLGMTRQAVLSAALGHGLTYYRAMCKNLKYKLMDEEHVTDSNDTQTCLHIFFSHVSWNIFVTIPYRIGEAYFMANTEIDSVIRLVKRIALYGFILWAIGMLFVILGD